MPHFFLFFVTLLISCQALAYKPTYSPEELTQLREKNACINCDLTGADLADEKYNNALVSGSDFTMAVMHYSEFKNTDFSSCLLIRSNGDSTNFTKSVFDGANLLYFTGKYATFSGASFKNANLKEAKLYQANFSKVDFTDTILQNADLSKSILIGSNITQAQLEQAKSITCAVLPNGRIYNPENKDCRYL